MRTIKKFNFEIKSAYNGAFADDFLELEPYLSQVKEENLPFLSCMIESAVAPSAVLRNYDDVVLCLNVIKGILNYQAFYQE